MKIAFLLNHYDVHQVPHVVPYAFELSVRHPQFEVQILSPADDQLSFAQQIGRSYAGHRVKLSKLPLSQPARMAEPLASKFFFARKVMTLLENTTLWSGFDAIVVPETTTAQLRRQPALDHVKLIRVCHGAGDQRGRGSFDDRMKEFDLVLVPGQKYAKELVADGHLEPNRLAISGYAKFELQSPGQLKTPQDYFQNGRPVVIYNPHHRRNLSSWWRMGRQVLDFFYNSPNYNLIFAPHVLLFKRPWGRGARLPKRYKNAPNVLIDQGSAASCDMRYLDAADLYLGDVSSQVYEFIRTPRPCVFLNAHGADYQRDPSYASWAFGPVVDDVSALSHALSQARSSPERFRPIQQERFDYTFAASGARQASSRGADIIAQFLTTGTISSHAEAWPANANQLPLPALNCA